MLTALYPHFCIEHIHGHHRNVATPADPATARFGETVFAFLPRTLIGSLVSAWRTESARIQRKGRGPLGLGDRRIRYPVLLAAMVAAIFVAFGIKAAAFFVLQGVIAILLLEVINYVEHYGLQRKRLPSGRYERVAPHHSWNASHRLTNWYLFNLQRHADHHDAAARPFYVARLVKLPDHGWSVGRITSFE